MQAPTGFWDPAGFTADGSVENFKRRRQTELKHGRISMLATMGYITPEIFVRQEESVEVCLFVGLLACFFWGLVWFCLVRFCLVVVAAVFYYVFVLFRVFGPCDSSACFVFSGYVLFCRGSIHGDMFCYVRIGQVGFVMT